MVNFQQSGRTRNYGYKLLERWVLTENHTEWRTSNPLHRPSMTPTYVNFRILQMAGADDSEKENAVHSRAIYENRWWVTNKEMDSYSRTRDGRFIR